MINFDKQKYLLIIIFNLMNNFKIYLAVLVMVLVIPACKKREQKRVLPPNEYFSWQDDASIPRKKRIVIFSSNGGGAHTAAASALKKYLGNEFDIQVVNAFSDVLNSLDLFYVKASEGEKFYNHFLQSQSILLVEAFASMGKMGFRYISQDVEDLFEIFLRKHKPDIMISVIPMLDGAMYRVAQKLDIPFAIIPVDLDVTNYCNGLQNTGFDKFFFGLNFDDDAIRSKMQHTGIKPEQIRYLGFPVRPEFLSKDGDKEQVKREFGIPADKKVAMVLMGSAGSKATLHYAKTFTKDSIPPVHLILCLGKNEKLRHSIEKLKFSDHVTVSIIGFTDRIADLMRISDVLITKSGPSSVCEALCVKTPMIIDHTRLVIWWEKMNIDFVRGHGFGDEIYKVSALPKMLKKYIGDEGVAQVMREKMKQFEFPDVRGHIRALIDEMLALTENNSTN